MVCISALLTIRCSHPNSHAGKTSPAAKRNEDKVLNFYTWSDYIAPDTIPSFEKLTGIKVNVSYFDTNEMLEAGPPWSCQARFRGTYTYCLAVAGIALYANKIQFRRPSYDQTLNWLIITMPLAAYLWFETQNASGYSIDSLRTGLFARLLPSLVLIILGLMALVVGIRRRSHSPNLAFIVCVGCLAYELRHLTTLSLQVKLIGWGTLVLLLTISLDRYLHPPRRGITSNRFAEDKGSLDLLQLAGSSALAPQSVQPPDAQFKGGGGTFGGGGVSGTY